MTCDEFRQQLDDDAPLLASMHEHAAMCAQCAEELRIARELERALTLVVPTYVSRDFNDAVLRRIRPSPLLQLASEPIVVIAIAIAIMLALQFDRVTMAVHRIIDGPLFVVAAIAMLLSLVSWPLFRAYERMTSP